MVVLYPSSIAAFGVPHPRGQDHGGPREGRRVQLPPTTIYGANKLYCEHLGRYYSHPEQLAADTHSGRVDFRCLPFPGLISAETMPSGGTSDYAPEMIHAAAAGQPYDCFVRPTPHSVHGDARCR